MHESRVAALEAKLAELSDTVGSYDRLRLQDLTLMEKLREQIVVLEKNNSFVIPASSSPDDDDSNLDIQALMRKLLKLKTRLEYANLRSENPVDLDEFFLNNGFLVKVAATASDHSSCKQEYASLKAEFENYKQTKVLVKHVHKKDEGIDVKMENLKREHESTIAKLKTQFGIEKYELKEEITALNTKVAQLCELEVELQKQRERSLALINEKQEEINSLRELLEPKPEWSENLAGIQYLNQAPSSQILHYVEELARREVDIQNLRKSKCKLELQMRELQLELVAKVEKFSEERRVLSDQVSRLERNQSRENANLEYLKNVVLKFLLNTELSSKAHMFNAIATILEFSDQETQRVLSKHPSWAKV
uniref:EOG090X04IO n=1 Tax=Lynceus sp. MCZ IZ 141354 TaxID=1930659 RepID=A0A9N6ZH39_9CRUS|nr:EOG090X04IO [Lynceus sp. MCZ IZ 141354]